jgi:hypothetical protein
MANHFSHSTLREMSQVNVSIYTLHISSFQQQKCLNTTRFLTSTSRERIDIWKKKQGNNNASK